ncbi:MAG TPA: beta-N-acetylhexosaminidase [Anaerolineales bacterium]|nr:beta-N-acetylhexosaminidase [Anaerolineales bacterium]
MHNPHCHSAACFACLIPKPAAIFLSDEEFVISPGTKIMIDKGHDEILLIGQLLAGYLRQGSGFEVAVMEESNDQKQGNIHLSRSEDTTLGEEGYELSITTNAIRLNANCPAGLFYGVQTFRQLLPTHSSETLSLPALSIRDTPRFEWRGAMLDVARHFFGVEDVKRYIDLISHYKINRLHMHLSDDQGWRIEIKSWPRLMEVGGSTEVGGGKGGYYTQEQYKEIIQYARSRYVTIVPEIDTPGHTNAALASYAELNSSEEAPALYIGTKVGFSSLWIKSEITYKFLDDVIRELAALTPTSYIHIGGDEAHATPEEQYKYFIKRIQEIVISHGNLAIGWNEIGEAQLLPGTIVQQWAGAGYQNAKKQGAKFILSPANKVYLDMKYDAATPLGLDWAGLISVKDAYNWEPSSYIEGLEESDILGLEAPLWTETVQTMKDIEYMTFPRLLGVAELAWSPKGQQWEEYRQRLAPHGELMAAMGINFFKSPDVEWV